VGFLSKLVRMIRVLERSFGMPSSRLVVTFFIVFGGSTMSARSKLVLLGSLQVCVVHGFLPLRRGCGLRYVRAGFARRCNVLRARML
jgi:hypothetical protein